VSGEAERGTGVADPERRALVNAQGALEVVRTASESVDERVAQIDDRTETQAAEMEAVVGDVSELSATIEEIAASATEATETSQRAAEEAATGRSAAADAMAGMERVRETGEAAAARVPA
jgi:methyl-accepting chemotaxis protein